MVRRNGGTTRKGRIKKTNMTRKNKGSQATATKCAAVELKTGVFGESEFNSGDGMLTTVWGPSLWHTLHTMSFNYPVNPTIEDKKSYQRFICNLRHVLPCKYCRVNLKNNFKSLPPTMKVMKNRETFSKYIYDLHELVNKMLLYNLSPSLQSHYSPFIATTA